MLSPVEEIWVQEILERRYTLSRKGYAILYVPGHPWAKKSGQMYRSRYIMNVLGRLTDRTMVVHHKDRDKLNDHPDNLEILTSYAHDVIHHAPLSEQTKQKISEARKGWIWSEEMRAKLSEAHKGIPRTEEEKRKLSEAMKKREITWGDKISKALKGRRPSDACLAARVEASRGKPLSEEHRRKVSESLKSYRASLPNVNAERDARIMQMRSEGKTLRAIAATVGTSYPNVYRVLAARKR